MRVGITNARRAGAPTTRGRGGGVNDARRTDGKANHDEMRGRGDRVRGSECNIPWVTWYSFLNIFFIIIVLFSIATRWPVRVKSVSRNKDQRLPSHPVNLARVASQTSPRQDETHSILTEFHPCLSRWRWKTRISPFETQNLKLEVERLRRSSTILSRRKY